MKLKNDDILLLIHAGQQIELTLQELAEFLQNYPGVTLTDEERYPLKTARDRWKMNKKPF